MSEESCVHALKGDSCDQLETLAVRMGVKQVMAGSWVSRKVPLITGYSITAAFQGSNPEVLLTRESCFVFLLHAITERERERERDFVSRRRQTLRLHTADGR
jgi:hypothetical protein